MQLFATLVIKGDSKKTIKWMTCESFCESNFEEFAKVLGYKFDGDNPQGYRMHHPYKLNKKQTVHLYGEGATPGNSRDLLPLYDVLVRILRENIAPSGGNNDNVVTPLCNLLLHANRIVEDPGSDKDWSVDVMDYIYNEMYEAMTTRVTIPYAPYIMKLIKFKFPDYNFSNDEMEPHDFKKLYEKKTVVKPPSVPSSSSAQGGSFMGDARRAAAPTYVPATHAKVKKLNWFQRNILCMNVDIRKEQYTAYKDRRQLAYNQELILHHASGSPAPTDLSDPLTFAQWNQGSLAPWTQIDHDLGGSSYTTGHDYDDDEEAEYEDDDEDDDDDDDDEEIPSD